MEVIPTACWSTPKSFEYCFDGIPEHSIVAVSSMGIQSSKEDQALFRAGLKELIDRKRPRLLLAYGQLRHCDDFDLPEVREYPTFWDRRRKLVNNWAAEDRLEPQTLDEDVTGEAS